MYVDYILIICRFYFEKNKNKLYCKNMENSLNFVCNGIETIFIEILNEPLPFRTSRCIVYDFGKERF